MHVILDTDVSKSTAKYLPAFAALNSEIVGRLDPDKDFVTAYAMDRENRCYIDDRAPDSLDKFQEVTIHALSIPPDRPGTYPAVAWAAIADKADKTAGHDIEIVVATDGDDDQNSRASRKAVRAAAARLAANARVSAVAVVGVSPENWGEVARELAPLKGRLRIFGRRQISSDDVSRFLDEREGENEQQPTGK